MDIKQLRYFHMIALEGQITRAAKKLHMAQPPLSQQLKQLEEELGVTLIERHGKKAELTDAGKVLFKKAEEILHLVEDTTAEVKEIGEGLKGILSIGSVKTCFSHLPDRLRQFQNDYPNVTFHLREGDTFHVSEIVRTREVEIGIVRLPLNTDEFSMIKLPSEPYVFVCFKDYKNTDNSGKTIRMEELKDVPLMLLHRINGVGQYELIIDECKHHGFEPNIICECPDAAMLLSLVSAGVGATILPKSTLQFFNDRNIQYKEIENSTIMAESAVIWLKNRYLSKAASLFLKTFENLEKVE